MKESAYPVQSNTSAPAVALGSMCLTMLLILKTPPDLNLLNYCQLNNLSLFDLFNRRFCLQTAVRASFYFTDKLMLVGLLTNLVS